jgi:hypothetical protein
VDAMSKRVRGIVPAANGSNLGTFIFEDTWLA